MRTRVLAADTGGIVHSIEPDMGSGADGLWTWTDVVLGSDEPNVGSVPPDLRHLLDLASENPVPGFDDRREFVLIVLQDRATGDVNPTPIVCALDRDRLVTVRSGSSPCLDAVAERLQGNSITGPGSPDAVLGLIARTVILRLNAVATGLEESAEGLVPRALAADDSVLAELMAIRSRLSTLRGSVRAQRDALDGVLASGTPHLSEVGRDQLRAAVVLANRTEQQAIEARVAAREILDGYRGAEAAQSTRVNTVLTLYAAVLLPLTVIMGFFGMDLITPYGDSASLWIWVTAVLLAASGLSIYVFWRFGWFSDFSRKGRAGDLIGSRDVMAGRPVIVPDDLPQQLHPLYPPSTEPE